MIASVLLHAHVMQRLRKGIERYCECSYEVLMSENVVDTLICVGVFWPCEALLNAGWIAGSICGPFRFCLARRLGNSNLDGIMGDVS
jgi:hypothetical protein